MISYFGVEIDEFTLACIERYKKAQESLTIAQQHYDIATSTMDDLRKRWMVARDEVDHAARALLEAIK